MSHPVTPTIKMSNKTKQESSTNCNSWQLDSVGDESGRRVSELGQTTPKTFCSFAEGTSICDRTSLQQKHFQPSLQLFYMLQRFDMCPDHTQPDDGGRGLRCAKQQDFCCAEGTPLTVAVTAHAVEEDAVGRGPPRS